MLREKGSTWTNTTLFLHSVYFLKVDPRQPAALSEANINIKMFLDLGDMKSQADKRFQLESHWRTVVHYHYDSLFSIRFTHLHNSACLEATCSRLGTSSGTNLGRSHTRGRTASLPGPAGKLHTR